ncbi:ferredoxin Fer [Natronosalvus hydrolyticus]
MYDTVLVATDGSDIAAAAGEYACTLADRFGATLHVVSVAETDTLIGTGEQGDPDEAVERIADQATERDLTVTTAVLEQADAIHRAILEYTDEHDIDVIVMGTHGRSGVDRFLVGSVAQQTLQESAVPVVTVHEATTLGPDFDRLVVPTDGSDSAMAAVEHATELALETGATIHLVHVTDRPPGSHESTTVDLSDSRETFDVNAVDRAIDRLRESELDSIDVSITGGRVDQSILAIAAERDADALVMGAHGRTGIRRYLLGSTTERMVRFANVPVFAISAPRGETVTVEYLDYRTVDDRGWSLEDGDLFEKANAADLEPEKHGTLEVTREEYILDAAEAAGQDWPFHCRAGGCVNCVVIVTEGEIEMDVQRSLSDEEVEEQNLRLTCVGKPASESLKIVYNAKHLDRLQDRVI